MKKYLFGILAVVLAIGFSAFTTKKAHKPFVSKTFYYKPGTFNQRIATGTYASGEVDFRLNSMDQNTYSVFRTLGSWDVNSNGLSQTTSQAFINQIVIANWEQDSDGNDADGISLEEALNNTLYTDYASGSKAIDLGSAGNAVTVTYYSTSAAF
jgi:hypothetical protein